MATSTPSICSSGNMTPQSTAMAVSPYSSTSRLRPISPSPPSGMTRSDAAPFVARHRASASRSGAGRARRVRGSMRLEALAHLRA